MGKDLSSNIQTKVQLDYYANKRNSNNDYHKSNINNHSNQFNFN